MFYRTGKLIRETSKSMNKILQPQPRSLLDRRAERNVEKDAGKVVRAYRLDI